MKRVLFCALLFFSTLFYSGKNLLMQGLGEHLDAFTITMIKGEQQYTKEVAPYAKLSDILTESDLTDVDLRKINLSYTINQFDVVVLPLIQETACISINTAELAELQELTGIGPSTAQKIIDYRTMNGSFKELTDLMNVKGIKEKLFEKIRLNLCL